MAGSLGHVIGEDHAYKGLELLENERDCCEALEEMSFVILHMHHNNHNNYLHASDHYYACMRSKKPMWPEWWVPGGMK